MSNSNEGEGPKVIDLNLDSSKPPAPKPLTEAEQLRREKIQRKQAEAELADYKKRMRSSNEMKQLQVEELELAVKYYHAKVAFRELQPKMDELDAKEEAERLELQKKQKEEYEAYIKKQKELEEAKEKEESKPDIIIPKTGKPRE